MANTTPTENRTSDMKVQFFQKMWNDPDFAAVAKTDPKQALAEFGVKVADGVDVEFICDTDKKKYIHIPAAPREGELTDQDLVDAVGGTGTLCVTAAASIYFTAVTIVGGTGTFDP